MSAARDTALAFPVTSGDSVRVAGGEPGYFVRVLNGGRGVMIRREGDKEIRVEASKVRPSNDGRTRRRRSRRGEEEWL